MVTKIKILHIFGCMDLGGAELRTLEWFKAIDHSKYEFHFYALSGRKGILDEQITHLQGKVFYGDLSFGFAKRFMKLLSREKYDVVHSHVYYFSGYILFLSYLQGVKTRIAHFRSSASDEQISLYKKMYNGIMRFAIQRYATDICAVCRKALDSLWQKNEQDQRFSVIYNGFSNHFPMKDALYVKRTFSIANEFKIIIHVGNFRKEKNHERLLKVFCQIKKRKPHVKLLLVGRQDDDIFGKINNIVEKNNLKDDVIFTGIRNDVSQLLGGSDLLLFPSVREGLPGVVIESCAMSTPVLASDVGGIPEIAMFFPAFVSSISLQEQDSIWCKKACEILDKDADNTSIDLGQTPFSLSTSLETLMSIYHKKVDV
ncbi:glycosyltransferase [Candidatus Uabimicrobium amorphum]|nr:glycosyltransferase [Candidatus Uabimicrobium amorphum]